jgi:tellurite resistance protein
MAETSLEPYESEGADGAADREVVAEERDEIREFVKTLSPDDIKSGNWFAKLTARSLRAYTEKATWEYFQEQYKGVPADAIVDQRIKMASRYAALEGGLSASAYTGAIAATIGSLGGSSPATVPAAAITLMVDLAFISQLQMRLAYDIAVLYRVPLDTNDPADLWKLIRVAFTIKSGELARESATKGIPVLLRPLIKRFYSGSVLQAAKGLPVVGKYLLQRNVIKIGIPVVGIPLAVVLNRYTTLLAGRHARAVFRNEARVIELAEDLSSRSKHPQLMLWIAWLVIVADGKTSDDEALLIRHLVRLVRDEHSVEDERLAQVIDIDSEEVWRLLESESGDLSDIIDVASRVALADGAIGSREQAIIGEIRDRCNRP